MMTNKGAALTSSTFEPRALLEALHKETKLNELKNGLVHLRNRQPAILEQQRELVCTHFDRFLEGVGAVNTAALAAAAVAKEGSAHQASSGSSRGRSGRQGHRSSAAAGRGSISAVLSAQEADQDEQATEVSCLLCTVTFYANHAHSLTRSP